MWRSAQLVSLYLKEFVGDAIDEVGLRASDEMTSDDLKCRRIVLGQCKLGLVMVA